MAEIKHKYPPEFYEAGEAMPDHNDVVVQYPADFQEQGIGRIRAIMAEQKKIEPVLKYFVDTGYRAMNKLLRGEPLRKRDNDRALVEMAKIDALLASDMFRSTRPLVVWRGITPDFARALNQARKADGRFSDTGYVIASTVPRQTPYILQIELPTGTPHISLHKFLANEVLLPHGGNFKVTDYHDLPQRKVRVIAHWLV